MLRQLYRKKPQTTANKQPKSSHFCVLQDNHFLTTFIGQQDAIQLRIHCSLVLSAQQFCLQHQGHGGVKSLGKQVKTGSLGHSHA